MQIGYQSHGFRIRVAAPVGSGLWLAAVLILQLAHMQLLSVVMIIETLKVS